MNAMDYLRVAPMINDCPNCGSDNIDNGEGFLGLKEDIIKRSCKCGFSFEYDVNNGTTRAKVKKAVQAAMQEIEQTAPGEVK